MECTELLFSGHAVRRMFARNISVDHVRALVESGEVIESYDDDKPYPSCLLLGSTDTGWLHGVIARDAATGRCVVVTVYWPDPEEWRDGLRMRKQ